MDSNLYRSESTPVASRLFSASAIAPESSCSILAPLYGSSAFVEMCAAFDIGAEELFQGWPNGSQENTKVQLDLQKISQSEYDVKGSDTSL